MADAYTVSEGGTLAILAPGALSNDTHADGDTLTAALVTGVSHGALTLSGDGSFNYTHDGTETTQDSFAYRVGVKTEAGLVSWWPGDGNTNDIVGATHGTLMGDAAFAPGVVGQGFSLDGDGVY